MTTLAGHPASGAEVAVAHAVERAREAGRAWAARPLAERVRAVGRIRRLVGERGLEIARRVAEAHPLREGGAGITDTLVAEVLPLAEACRFVECDAKGVLSRKRLGARGRPMWLFGVTGEITREPWGVVLVIAPSNYPLFLPGVQAVQALAAGNAVVLKPGRDGAAAAEALRSLAVEAGVPSDAMVVLEESAAAAEHALAAGIDKVVLTGSATTGRAVLRHCAETLTPSTMELSGCDAAFVLRGADLDLTAKAVAFGLRLNGGATCISPRRVFVDASVAEALRGKLARELESTPEVAVDARAAAWAWELVKRSAGRVLVGGPPRDGRMLPTVLVGVGDDDEVVRSDIFAPVASLVPVADMEEALRRSARCAYALGASIFGPADEAARLAQRVNAGTITINDVVVPTADPRVPFGGRGESGFGSTRGAEGLLEMTRPKAVMRSAGKLRPHYEPTRAEDAETFAAYLRWSHGRGGLGAVVRFARGMMGRGKQDS